MKRAADRFQKGGSPGTPGRTGTAEAARSAAPNGPPVTRSELQPGTNGGAAGLDRLLDRLADGDGLGAVEGGRQGGGAVALADTAGKLLHVAVHLAAVAVVAALGTVLEGDGGVAGQLVQDHVVVDEAALGAEEAERL